ncbi:MAG: hypothetical protein M3Z65_04290 [Chloroflexota bacterium]|nr:hypothetical protein [Chloroflexota bacterium]
MTIKDVSPGAANTLTRAGLILTATGIVSAATVRHAIDETGDIVYAYGFLLYLILILIAVPRRPPRFAPLLAFAAFAAMYLTAAFTEGANDLGLSLYVIAAAAAYVATPRVFRSLTVAAFAMWSPAFRLFGPTPLGDLYPAVMAVATVLSLFFVVVALLARTGDREEQLRRIGLAVLGVAIVSSVSERHFVVASLSIAPDEVWALLIVVAFPIIAFARLRGPARDALATGLALGGYILVGLALILGKPYHVDAVVVVHRAAEIFLAGGDPYRDLSVLESLQHFGLDPALGTHLEDGSQLTTYNYPALSFLVAAPFIAAGLTDIRFIYLAEVAVLALVLIRAVRVPWRPLVCAAIVGNAVIARQNILAGVDPLWALLVLLAFLAIARRWWSPLLLGLAIAARQPAWFFVPFYLVAVWRREGRAEALRRAAIAAAAAAVPNLPFFLWSPLDFLAGVMAPMLGALEPYGVGIIRFAIDGEIPLLARGVYGIASAASLVILVVVLWRNWKRIPNAALVFPSLALWFAWRSLQNYFSFTAVFAMSGDESLIAGDSLPEDEPRLRP